MGAQARPLVGGNRLGEVVGAGFAQGAPAVASDIDLYPPNGDLGAVVDFDPQAAVAALLKGGVQIVVGVSGQVDLGQSLARLATGTAVGVGSRLKKAKRLLAVATGKGELAEQIVGVGGGQQLETALQVAACAVLVAELVAHHAPIEMVSKELGVAGNRLVVCRLGTA